MKHPHRPEVDAILQRLKDFQRKTVDYLFQRLYLDPDATDRFLIADEVGLGKTLVGRGLIARAIDHLWDSVERIDIIYVCSNADIARQNARRLRISEDGDVVPATRITMLPLQLKDLESRKLNLVSFTPGTAFDLASSTGLMQERAVLYWMLEEVWGFKSSIRAQNVLRSSANPYSFERAVDGIDPAELDPGLTRAFYERLRMNEKERGPVSFRQRFMRLCDVFHRYDARVSSEDLDERTRLVGELREELATACLHALQPDLILLDEFQRFKYLLDPQHEESKLAQRLFRYPKAKTVLVSATPYKMYTIDDEAQDDDHYTDFCQTLDFLFDGHQADYRGLLEGYRRELHTFDGQRIERLKEIKGSLELLLRKVMVRTERLAVTADRNGMLTEIPSAPAVTKTDLRAYVGLQKAAAAIGTASSIEYWKSAPYLLNFMNTGEYKLKVEFDRALADGGALDSISSVIRSNPEICLPWEDIRAYRKIDPANARLRDLVAETIGSGSWRLLWLPPALPYYELSGPFGECAEACRKRLIFSSWRIVPRVIATMLSYEAEREIFESAGPVPENTPEARRKLSGLLRFSKSEGRLSGMPVFGIVFPSVELATLVDPMQLLQTRKRMSAGEALRWASERLEPKVAAFVRAHATQTAVVDEAWYWAAPLLLDRERNREELAVFLDKVSDTSNSREDDDDSLDVWTAHVRHAIDVIDGKISLGKPPADLVEMVSLMALAAPGPVALRSFLRLQRVTPDNLSRFRSAALRIAQAFRNMINLPEATTVIRGLNSSEPFWRRVLEYNLAGGLQSVLDEYFHVLVESIGLVDPTADDLQKHLPEAVESALSIRAASIAVDEIHADPERRTVTVAERQPRMRARFAARFDKDDGEDEKRVNRKEQLRDAFNSPFWPFVLATTSIGQEGLDFHLYCHSVVHWNLPSNPVDLEQREGRVHRYKGHAVRKNLAARYRREPAAAKDPWAELFERAKRDRQDGESDLVPFWVYQVEGGATIERHLPFEPMSRDRERMASLRRALSLYRMVFGQSRQQDLVATLNARLSRAAIDELGAVLRVDLSPDADNEEFGSHA
jgi:hypothetical protein